MSAIELDNDTTGLAAEIDNIRSDWHLTAKLQPAQTTVTHAKPQNSFSVSLIVPQPSCQTNSHKPSPAFAELIIGPAFGRTRWLRHPLPAGEGKSAAKPTVFISAI